MLVCVCVCVCRDVRMYQWWNLSDNIRFQVSSGYRGRRWVITMLNLISNIYLSIYIFSKKKGKRSAWKYNDGCWMLDTLEMQDNDLHNCSQVRALAGELTLVIREMALAPPWALRCRPILASGVSSPNPQVTSLLSVRQTGSGDVSRVEGVNDVVDVHLPIGWSFEMLFSPLFLFHLSHFISSRVSKRWKERKKEIDKISDSFWKY